MRPLALTVLVVGLALVAPPATASHPDAEVAIDAPAEADVAANGELQFTLSLVLRDFWCFDETAFPVDVTATADNATATPRDQTVRFVVPEGSHYGETYEGRANVTVALRDFVETEATLRLVATFTHDGDPCFAPGGFDAAEANATVRVSGTPSSAPPQPAPGEDAPPASNETADAPDAPQENATASPSDPPEGADAQDAEDGAPDESTGGLPSQDGYIGDYVPQREAEVPAAPVALVLAAALLVAFAARRARR